MDPSIDIKRRIDETMAQVARQYVDNQRANPGATGRSPDGLVEVTLDGLGDVTDVRVRPDDLPRDVADRLADAFKAAWRTAAREVGQATVERSSLAQRPGMTEFVQDQLAERYGPPPADEPSRERRARDADDEDFADDTFIRRANQ